MGTARLIRPLRTCVYLMHQGEFHKIGSSANPEKRRAQLDVGPQCVEIVHLIQSRAACHVETAMHHVFAPKRVRKEWFLLSADDVARFRSLARCDSPRDLASAWGVKGIAWIGRHSTYFDDFRERVGLRIKELREAQGYTQECLALSARVPLNSLVSIERGSTRPGRLPAQRICAALGVASLGVYYDREPSPHYGPDLGL